MRDTGTWRAMEELYEQGLVKAIGVTNYSIRHLKQLMKSCKIKRFASIWLRFPPVLASFQPFPRACSKA